MRRSRVAVLVLGVASAVGGGVIWWIWRRRAAGRSRAGVQEGADSTNGDSSPASASADSARLLNASLAMPTPVVIAPFVGFEFKDIEFASKWRLARSGVWYDYSEDDPNQMTPSAVCEYQLTNVTTTASAGCESSHVGGDQLALASARQLNLVAEDMMLPSMSAAEYVERSRQGLPMVDLDDSTSQELLFHIQESIDAISASKPTGIEDDETLGCESSGFVVTPTLGRMDTCLCAFTEMFEDSGASASRVINVVAVRGGIAVVVQLISMDSEEDRKHYLPLFTRMFQSALRQFASPSHPMELQHRINFVQCALPSVRVDYPGVLMTIPARRLQWLPSTHPVAQLLFDRIYNRNSHNHRQNHISSTPPPAATNGVHQPSRLGNIIACIERRPGGGSESTNGTVEMYLVQLPSRSTFDRVAQDMPLKPLEMGRPMAVLFRHDLLCFVVTVADTQDAAEWHAKCIGDGLRPFHGHKRTLAYLNGPSQISYVLPWPTDSCTFLTHYFGPFDFQFFPSRASPERSSFRIAVRDIVVGESFALMQRSVTAGYDERWVTRKPSVEGWSRLEVSLESPEGRPLTEYVTMLEHEGRFLHISWTTPKGQGVSLSEEVRRCLLFHSL